MAGTKGKSASAATLRQPRSFLTTPSTVFIVLVRLLLVLRPELFTWLYRSSVLSVLVRPHQTLAHLREARAIQALASPNGMSFPSARGTQLFVGGAYVANDSIRIPPLVLTMLSPLIDSSHPEWWLSLILFLVDVAIAYLLEQVCCNVLITAQTTPRTQQEEKRQRELPEIIQPSFAYIFPIYSQDNNDDNNNDKTKPLISIAAIPRLAALLYFGSPFTILPASLYHCWQNLPTLFVVASIYEASCGTGYYVFASCLLAVAAYLEPYSAVYAIPIILLFCLTERRSKTNATTESSIRSVATIFLTFFLLWSLALQGMTLSLLGSMQLYGKALVSVYGETWLQTSPNLSLQWYFRMQIFARFRDYFGAMFLGLPYVLIGPLTIRLWKYPEVLVSEYGETARV